MARHDELTALGPSERRQLLRFVASFAWADLQITPAEVAFVHRLMSRLRLSPAEALEVAGWLKTPPLPDAVDPTEIPKRHRQIFVDVMRELVEADGNAPQERETLVLFERLTR